MVIFLLWITLICCCVANGYIYDHVDAPQSYHYMMIVGLVAVILLFIHRLYTRHWKPIKEAHSQHIPVFISSTFTAAIVGGSSLFAIHTGEVTWGFFFASFTGFILFGLAALKEKNYVWKLAVHIGSLIFDNDLF